MKKILQFFTVLVTFLFLSEAHSQSTLSHEVGVSFGIATFQTDYGESGDFSSGNISTFSFSAMHYLNFFGNTYSWKSGSTYFSEHFKLKTELNYISKVTLKYKGSLDLDTENGQKLDAMTGEVKTFNIGTNLEYHFLGISNQSSSYFQSSGGEISPFVSLGIHYTFYDPDILVDGVSIEGKQEPHTDLIDKWQEGAVYLDKGATFAASLGAGVRYNVGDFDLLFDTRWQLFFDDKVDGLDESINPLDSQKITSQNNDSMVMINFGVIYAFK